MKTLNKIPFFIFLIIFSSCSSHWSHRTPIHVKVGNSAIHKTSIKLAKKHSMCVIGDSGMMMYCIKEMGISFQIFHPLTKDEARKLAVDCVLEFLDDINSNREVQPYLSVIPFKPKNVEIEIFSSNPDNSDVYDPYIEVVAVRKGNVTFATKSPAKKYGYENFYKETFEEALQKVQDQQLNANH